MSQYGTTYGVGLIQKRLALLSSWNTEIATLNHGVFEHRVFSITNGLVLYLLLLQIVVLLKGLSSSHRGKKWFLPLNFFRISFNDILSYLSAFLFTSIFIVSISFKNDPLFYEKGFSYLIETRQITTELSSDFLSHLRSFLFHKTGLVTQSLN